MRKKEALKRAQARYAAKGAVKAVTKGYNLKCHVVHDADVISILEKQKNKNGYLKELIRKDIREDC